ncbi:MAG: response regulator transcription factor [Ignavibacteriales bacterium]|nr:response regulator transcription factor [Ignavibacteriales bacterium]
MKKIVIVEKIKNIREGIKILINRFSDYDCSYTFENLNDFKEEIDNIKPNVLLIDLEHKGISVIDEIKQLKLRNPELLIVMLTMNEENEKIFDALSNGAIAYIHKNAPSQKLMKLLEDVVAGKTIINSLIARKTIKFISDKKINGSYQKEELKLLQKVTEGNNLFAIEKSLKMSIDEIKINFRRIFEKLFELSKNEVVRI